MADYTIVNLQEVEDQAPRFGLAPGAEARFARVPLELEKSGVSYFRLAPEFRLPFGHKHGEQEEIYLVLSGSLRMRLEDEEVELRQWDAIRVPGNIMRGMEGGPDGAVFVAYGAPNTENADAEMAQDWWSD